MRPVTLIVTMVFPTNSGGWWIGWPRFTLLLVGPVIISLGFTMNIQANVGQGPWQAFHVGISMQTPLSIGVAGQIVSGAVMLIAWRLGVRPGIGTALNIVLGGIIQDILIYNNVIPEMHDVVTGYIMMLTGAVVMGMGTALYVKAQIGAGPRDSLMVALSTPAHTAMWAPCGSRWTGWPYFLAGSWARQSGSAQ